MPLKTQTSLRLPFTVALLQPLPHILQIVEKGPFATKVSDLSLLYYTHPFIGDTVSYISIVVHAVSNQLTLGRQGKMLDEFARCSQTFLQVLVLPDADGARTHGRGPAVRWMGLIDIH